MADDIDDLDKNILEVIAKQSPMGAEAAQPVALKVVDNKRVEKKLVQATKTTTAAPQVNVVIHQAAPAKQEKQRVYNPLKQKKKAKRKKHAKMIVAKKIKPSVTVNSNSIHGSMDKLAKVVRQLVVLLGDLQKDTRAEKMKLWKKLEDLEIQNEKIARGILAVADLVREQHTQHEDYEEARRQHMQQTPPTKMSMSDLRLPGLQSQMQMPDRLPERQPLFLNKMPQFREMPMQNLPQNQQATPIQQMPSYQQQQQVPPPYQQQSQPSFPPVQQQVNFPQPPIQQFKIPDLPLPIIKEGDKEKEEIIMG